MRTLLISLVILLSTISISAQQSTLSIQNAKSSIAPIIVTKPYVRSNLFSFLNGFSVPDKYIHYDSLFIFDSSYQVLYEHVRTYNSQNLLANDMVYKMINNNLTNYLKTDFIYNSSANIYQEITQNWENSFWSPNKRLSFYFDSLGNVTKKVDEEKDVNGILDSLYVVNRVYNLNSKISEINYQAHNNNQWFTTMKAEISYDASNRPNCIIESQIKNNQLSYYRKDSIYYNSNNDITKQVLFSYSGGIWKKFLEEDFTFNTAGNIAIKYETNFSWNYTEHLKSTYTYNSSGLILLINTEKLDNSNVWTNHTRETFTYNSMGQLILDKIEFDTTNSWLNDNRVKWDFTYDANGNLTTSIYSFSQMNNWTPQDKQIYSYDNLNRSLSGESNSYNNGWFPSLATLYIQDSSYALEPVSAVFYQVYFPANTTDIFSAKQSIEQITLFPNPTHDKLRIIMKDGTSHAEIKIFDVTGKRIMDKDCDLGKSIDVSDYKKGIYLIKIKTNTISQTLRFIKE